MEFLAIYNLVTFDARMCIMLDIIIESNNNFDTVWILLKKIAISIIDGNSLNYETVRNDIYDISSNYRKESPILYTRKHTFNYSQNVSFDFTLNYPILTSFSTRCKNPLLTITEAYLLTTCKTYPSIICKIYALTIRTSLLRNLPHNYTRDQPVRNI